MTRFLMIASIRRGAIEPAEVLDDLNQAVAFTRWEGDEFGPSERVVWRGSEPYATEGKPPGSERLPRISRELRATLRGVYDAQ